MIRLKYAPNPCQNLQRRCLTPLTTHTGAFASIAISSSNFPCLNSSSSEPKVNGFNFQLRILAPFRFVSKTKPGETAEFVSEGFSCSSAATIVVPDKIDLIRMVDGELNGEFPEEEAIRFIKVGLLCVQEDAKLRPKMTEALEMLSEEGENEIEGICICRPGLVSDLRDIRIKDSSQG
ncbi:putative serine/threonine-protein kinase [Senna tora]|uniref:Putative serine/threonine-protein kinase n=1 Tax=Senna tora TaxID=362788 RepID=A0A834XJ33_9FABA|nr:putative serine/threonine-protein kinase [Senna tora]